ncbi:MAG: hypothetical protein ACTSU5_00055 [Promethearchaeota archaeon]
MSRTKKVTLIVVAVVLVPFVAGYCAFEYAVHDFYEFNDVPTTEAPFPLLALDEAKLHVAVEGNLEDDGFLGAEERQARYHLPLGFLGSVIFEKNKTPDTDGLLPEGVRCVGLGNHGDSPFLTGHYLMAQALRWATYNRTENLAGQRAAELQVSRALDGYFILLHVSGNPGHLVRYAFPLDTFPGSQADNEFDTFRGRYCRAVTTHTRWGDVSYPERDWSGWMYSDDTSRDQNLGTMFGLAGVLAFCGNDTLKARAGALAVEITECMIRDNWQVAEVLNDNTSARAGNSADFDVGFLASRVNRLEFLKIASVVDPDKYAPLYRDALVLSNDLPTLGHEALLLSSVTSYYPINLAWESIWPLVYFEESASEGGLREKYLEVLERVHYAAVKNHRNAFYQCLYLSVLAPGRATAEARVQAEVRDSLERMSRDRWDGFNVYHGANFSEIGLDASSEADRESLVDPKSTKYEKAFSFLTTLGGDTYSEASPFREHTKWAVPVDWRYPSDFIWQRSPFHYLDYTLNMSRREYPHADFTLVYWFSRYLGIVGDPATPPTPRTIPQSVVAEAWQGFLWPSYSQAKSILEGLP